ncbi:soluble epoxide hydrolase [Xylaria venustula]|nr:soluble epoxide hydrolase [Xylaria venustula]
MDSDPRRGPGVELRHWRDESRYWRHTVEQVTPDVRISCITCDSLAPLGGRRKGTILLIHGFPQSSYQFRHVITDFARHGYRVLAPDYRGVGASSKPSSGFTKTVMAEDLVRLLDVVHGPDCEPVHVVGHDIGGMIAWALASRHPDRVASLVWGECPLPGTTAYIEDRTTNAVKQFHFIFHSEPDLAVALVSGRERIYVNHFFQKLAYRLGTFEDKDIDHYAQQYAQPGALRFAFEMYRAFEDDARENKEWIAENGKLSIPTMNMMGKESSQADPSSMLAELHQEGTYKSALIPQAGHWIAEENPTEFVLQTVKFIESLGKV